MINDNLILELTRGIIIVYIAISIIHISIQFLFAHLHHVSQRQDKKKDIQRFRQAMNSDNPPQISVIYPIYNEQPAVIEQVLSSALVCKEEIPNLSVVVVDDGSPNREQVREIYDKYASQGITVLYQENGGKRHAQHTGFNHVSGDFIITVDSDTIINPDGIVRLVAPMLRNDKVGAVTGDVRVENRNTNLLTKLISFRYWTAFNLERAAQSFSGSMLCCSGPFSIYRSDVVNKVKEDYINQFFLGKRCTYGDDRHLTNLVLKEGYRTAYQEGAVAYTFVPETMREYMTQQTRWNKSFFREFLWTARSFNKISLFSLWDMFIQPLLFFLFIFILANQLLLFMQTGDLRIPFYYLILLVVMASIRSLYGLLRTFNPNFLLFIIYGFIHVLILMPIRFKALLTLNNNGWGTRQVNKQNEYVNFASWFIIFSATLFGIAFSLQIAQSGFQNFFASNLQNTADAGYLASRVVYFWSLALVPFVLLVLLFLGEWFVTQGERFSRTIKLQTSGVFVTILFASTSTLLPIQNIQNPSQEVAGVLEQTENAEEVSKDESIMLGNGVSKEFTINEDGVTSEIQYTVIWKTGASNEVASTIIDDYISSQMVSVSDQLRAAASESLATELDNQGYEDGEKVVVSSERIEQKIDAIMVQ